MRRGVGPFLGSALATTSEQSRSSVGVARPATWLLPNKPEPVKSSRSATLVGAPVSRGVGPFVRRSAHPVSVLGEKLPSASLILDPAQYICCTVEIHKCTNPCNVCTNHASRGATNVFRHLNPYIVHEAVHFFAPPPYSRQNHDEQANTKLTISK
jgi:hypothetical protein